MICTKDKLHLQGIHSKHDVFRDCEHLTYTLRGALHPHSHGAFAPVKPPEFLMFGNARKIVPYGFRVLRHTASIKRNPNVICVLIKSYGNFPRFPAAGVMQSFSERRT